MKKAKGIWKYLGLMFRTDKTNPIEFDFDKPVLMPIHSCFVFFPFKAIWHLEDGTKEERIIFPFEFNVKPSKKFTKLVEIPLVSFCKYDRKR